MVSATEASAKVAVAAKIVAATIELNYSALKYSFGYYKSP